MTPRRPPTPPRLSSGLKISDINDFLTPSAACILPLSGGATASVTPAPPGSVLSPIVPTPSPAARATAKVTLSDCLSCSGCVTSAETVLLSSTNLDKVRATLLAPARRDRAALRVVAALSQQAVASLAVEMCLGLQEAAGVLATFFRVHLHVDAVVDLAFARHLAHEEAAREFVERRRAGAGGVVIASACPGWVTYAEKTQGEEVLGRISRVRSPQAVAGAVVPRVLGAGKRTWLMCVMPCHDKKLEAAREEFRGEAGDAEVEAVLTAGEVLELAREMGVDIRALRIGEMDRRFRAGDGGFGTVTGSGSGGYAEYVLRVAARELLGVELEGEVVMEKVSRSGDVRSVTVRSEDGRKQLRFGTAYGFRSLQSVLRKVRRGECEYDYIELMACPGGCNNGGGQIPSEAGDKKSMNRLLQEVERVYLGTDNPARPMDVSGVRDLLAELRSSGDVGKVLHTTYERREQNAIQAVNNW